MKVRLFRSKEARKAYCKFQELASLITEEVSLKLLRQFDAVFSKAVGAFAWFSKTYIAFVGAVAATTHVGSRANDGNGEKNFGRGGTIPQDSALDLKRLLPTVATNLKQICYRLF